MDNDNVPESAHTAQDRIENSSRIDEAPAEPAEQNDVDHEGKASPVPADADGEQDEASALKHLAAVARDQDDLERDIGRQADQMLLEQADERDQKRKDKAQLQKQRLLAQVRSMEQRLKQPSSMTSAAATRLKAEISHIKPQIEALDSDLEQIDKRMQERREGNPEADAADSSNTRRPGESRRDFLIRTGKITPFSHVGAHPQVTSSNLADVMLDAEEGEDGDEHSDGDVDAPAMRSHRNLLKPGFQEQDVDDILDERPAKRRRLSEERDLDENYEFGSDEDEDTFLPKTSDQESSDGEMTVMAEGPDDAGKTGKKRRHRRKYEETDEEIDPIADLTGVDDGDEEVYTARLAKWSSSRRRAREQGKTPLQDAMEGATDGNSSIEDEWLMPHPTRPDTVLDGGFRIPGDIYPSLFDYQKTGVQWLWELYSQQVGGIVGDEMGLGKTIQIIAFLAGLHHSNKLDPKKPVIVVTPATVMKQWVNEFHQWWPPLRVSILHTSGSGMLNLSSERRLEDRLEAEDFDAYRSTTSGTKAARRVLNRVLKDGHVLVTTYSGLQSYADLLLPIDWGYAVLDEGHKIRNPNAKITIYCKSLRTANRIILSGTPMQNNLTELWSLFDFIFPLRLGNLVSFRTQFEVPIKQGGYANASNLQVETALKCAEALKDTISPYLLQRFKIDVAADLPKKSEQVLFCRLTKTQRDAYESFLRSEEMTSILVGKRHVLYGIDLLRKICNHPDLQDHKTLSKKPNYPYGDGKKSGKMQVVKALLQLWRDTGHKTLLFAQHRIMLDILERFLKLQGGFSYRRMDGTTPIKDRQSLVDEFNQDQNLHVFLLTTKVGGLGVNLTGADRVIIFDPDWNPSTDMQARERSWRLGQKREVMIYRLMTAGTIEEKIYHRQIFKQFLTNKILRDPKQRQTFQLKDLHDLFTLGNADDEFTETGGLFKGTEVKFNQNPTDEDNVTLRDAGQEPGESSKMNSIVGISHREDFANGQEKASSDIDTAAGTAEQGSAAAKPNDDSRILSSIFSRSGVHSALEHDAIIAGSSKSRLTADPAIIAREAKRVAALAAKELQRAGEQARSVPIGTPTWTGVYGSAGRPEPRPVFSRGRGGFMSAHRGRGGMPSSTSVLASLAARQGLQDDNASSVAGSRASTPASEDRTRGVDFLTKIRDYLVAQGGSAYTQMLIDHFNRLCRTPERTAEFKEMLRAIAVLDRGTTASRRSRPGASDDRGGRARWVLRKEYGGTA